MPPHPHNTRCALEHWKIKKIVFQISYFSFNFLGIFFSCFESRN